jgi:excisionase family DNA binding protein
MEIADPMKEGRFLSIEEVSQYLNIKLKTLYSRVPEIPHYRVGRLIRFKKEDIDQWMESKREETAPALKTRVVRRSASMHPVDDILRRAIDEVRGSSYNSPCGKSDRIKGLRKEG